MVKPYRTEERRDQLTFNYEDELFREVKVTKRSEVRGSRKLRRTTAKD